MSTFDGALSYFSFSVSFSLSPSLLTELPASSSVISELHGSPKESLGMPGVWIAAASQNAFDTGAGISVLLTYATFMSRASGIVRYSFLIPITNNLVR